MEWREVPEPRLEGGGDALVRPLAVARCEIDPFLVRGLFPAKGPFALGHEAIAEIVAIDDGVRRLAVGQRVVVSFQVSCGRCAACGEGHTAICDRYPTLSDYGMQPLSGVEYGGMLSDLVRVPHAEAMLHPIPLGADPVALASVADNVVDGYRTVARHLARRPGADVLFVCHGNRSIALYGVQTAVALGAGKVTFASDDAQALSLAESRDGASATRSSSTAAFGATGFTMPSAPRRPRGSARASPSTPVRGTCRCRSRGSTRWASSSSSGEPIPPR